MAATQARQRPVRMKQQVKPAPAFRRQLATIVQMCERSTESTSCEYTEQIDCTIKRIKLSTRFWDHLSDKHSDYLFQSESIDMARADVEIELAKIKRKAEYLAKRRAWMWFWPAKVLKKWLFLMQTVSQIELSFQGLCRQVIQENESNAALLKQQQTGPPLVVKQMVHSEDGSATSTVPSPDAPSDRIAAHFTPQSAKPPEVSKELEAFLLPDSDSLMGSQTLQQFPKQRSTQLTVSVANLDTSVVNSPAQESIHEAQAALHTQEEQENISTGAPVCNARGVFVRQAVQKIQETLSELPVSNFNALKREFSGTATPDSIASPEAARYHHQIGGTLEAGNRMTSAAHVCHVVPKVQGAELDGGAVERADCESEAPELARVQTAPCDGHEGSHLAPVRILRDFEARTFGPPHSLHNLVPLAVPASAASSPRSVPQSPLGASRPQSATGAAAQRASKLPNAPSDLSTYSGAFSTGPYAPPIAPSYSSTTSQLYGAFSLKEQQGTRSHFPAAYSPNGFTTQQHVDSPLDGPQGSAAPANQWPSARVSSDTTCSPFHTPSYPTSAPASLDPAQFEHVRPAPLYMHVPHASHTLPAAHSQLHTTGSYTSYNTAPEFSHTQSLAGSPHSMMSATHSFPSIEQQASDIDRLKELEAAAALGSAEAQYEIACMVLEGRGVPRDVKFATAWFGYAASSGHPEALKNLSFLSALDHASSLDVCH